MGTSLVERRRHRSWPDDLKREIVAASLEPGSSVSLVARRYDVNANQVFAWRKRYRSGPTEPTGLQLMPVTVTPDRPIASVAARANEQIEIELVGGYRVRIGKRKNLVRVHVVAPRHQRHRRSRFQRRRYNLSLQIVRPRPVPTPLHQTCAHNRTCGHSHHPAATKNQA